MSTPTIDIEHLRGWIGRSQTDSDPALARHARLMAATVDRPGPALADGDPLPHCWHWLYFLEGLPPGRLGPDGHPERGGFMPPVPLPNRMWAGGDVRFEGPIPLGATMDKRSTIKSVEHKSGRSGDLVFVTVEHEISVDGSRRLHELQNIVYKSPAPAGNARPPADGGPAPGQHVRKLTPDTTMLFRYSALTFNGHRIHYDQDYCRDVEGYDNCVIHGPLVATLLCGLAADVGPAPLRRFSYRGLRPAILGVDLEFNATVEGNSARLWSRLPDGGVSMQAEAEYEEG